MEAIITYENKILLEYNIVSNRYEISVDDGSSYPYEFYEEIEICGRDFYLIYLEDLSMIPTSNYDRWTGLDEAILFLENEENPSKEYIEVLKDLNNKDIL